MGFGCRVIHSKSTCDQVRKCEGWFPHDKGARKGCKDAAKGGEIFSSKDDYLKWAGVIGSEEEQKQKQKRKEEEEQKKWMVAGIIGFFFLLLVLFLMSQIISR
jgi:hypothetical protein